MPTFKNGDRIRINPQLSEWGGEEGIILYWVGEISRWSTSSSPIVVEMLRVDVHSEALYVVQLDKHERPSLVAESFLVPVTS